jgi:hypothetical protein
MEKMMMMLRFELVHLFLLWLFLLFSMQLYLNLVQMEYIFLQEQEKRSRLSLESSDYVKMYTVSKMNIQQRTCTSFEWDTYDGNF